MSKNTPKNAMILAGELSDALARNTHFNELQPWQREAVRVMTGSIAMYVASGGNKSPLRNVGDVLALIQRGMGNDPTI